MFVFTNCLQLFANPRDEYEFELSQESEILVPFRRFFYEFPTSNLSFLYKGIPLIPDPRRFGKS